MTALTNAQLAEMEARENAATRGPWRFSPIASAMRITSGPRNIKLAETFGRPARARANGQFIAHARTDVPALVASLRAATARIAELERELADANLMLAKIRELRAHGL